MNFLYIKSAGFAVLNNSEVTNEKIERFSLIEMMIVLAIVAVVAAASAPMLNKKMVSSTESKSWWEQVDNTNSIAYNFSAAGINNNTVNIGGLAEIKKLEVFNYTFKDDTSKTPRVGVIAQDLKKIFPDAVVKREDGFLKIRMEDMFYALVNAVKELDLKLNSQDKRISELEKQNKDLLNRIEALEKSK